MNIPVHIVIVTHNSAELLPICLAYLNKQTHPITSIKIVDTGSDNIKYLNSINCVWPVWLKKLENIGFGRANNIGFSEIDKQDGMVLFLNPDTFLPPDYISLTVKVLNENKTAAVVSGKLLGFNAKLMQPTGKIDSTGIFRKWYGRWFDRGQGAEDHGQYNNPELIPAVCGALMCCRIKAMAKPSGEVFDSDFFLYKEDIELSLRLRKEGWDLLYDPRLEAYHCRGWNPKRSKISHELRVMAAKNEVLLYKKHPSVFMAWALVKLLLVKLFRV